MANPNIACRRVRKRLDRGEAKVVEVGDPMTALTKPEFAATVIELLRTGRTQ